MVERRLGRIEMIEEYTYNYTELIESMIEAQALKNIPNSITQGEGAVSGTIAEFKLAKILGGKWSPTFNYDVLYNGYRLEVKAKRTTVGYVRSYYDASIASLNISQKCDFYVFARVNEAMMKCWFCGMATPEYYFKNAVFHTKGEVDPDNSFTFTNDCYNVPYSKLSSISSLKNMLPGTYR